MTPEDRRILRISGLVAIAVLVVVGVASAVAINLNLNGRSEALQRAADTAATSLRTGIAQAALKLEAIDGFFQGSDDVTEAEFDVFADTLDLSQDPDSVAVAMRVTDEELTSFAEGLRRARPGIELTELGDGGELVSLSSDAYRVRYIISYHRPSPGDTSLVGYDMASQPTRLETIIASTVANKTVVSDFLRLVGSNQDPDGLLIVTPVHDPSGQSIGVAVASANVSTLVPAWVPGSVLSELEVRVTGERSDEFVRPTMFRPVATSYAPLPGRSWQIQVTPRMPDVTTVTLVAGLALLPLALGSGGFLLTRSMLTRRSLTRQLELSDALAAERQRRVEVLSDYELITENSADLIARHSPDLTYLWVSPSIRNVLGYDPAEAIGTTPWGVTHRDDMKSVETSRQELVEGANTSSVEHRARHANGKWVWLHTVSRAVRDEDGCLVEIQSASRDVSEQVRQRSELIESKNAVEMAAAEKTRFLSTVSHEIRTPLSAVRGLSELLLKTELRSEQREQIETIQLASNDVVTLVNDLLDLAKAEGGRLRLDVAPFDLTVTIDNVIRVFAAQAEAKELGLRADVRNAPVGLIGDSHRLHQILVNLIGNALKFTHDGSITVGARPVGDSDDSTVTIHFEVADTGLGIPDERLAAIFEEFEQAEDSTARRFGGSGLGLGISRELVYLMGGVIGVESEMGTGSTFWFDIPFPLAQPTDAGWRRCRVVGRPMTRAPLVAMLRSDGWLVDEGDGVEAMSDLAGPIVFGGTVDDLAAMRIPDELTFVDAVPQRGNADKARRLGVRGYLGSPVGIEELTSVVKGVAAGARFATRHDVEANVTSLLVLAADDAPSNRLLVERALTRRGHRVVAVPGGVRALEEVMSSSNYDVVILDGQMPDLSGIEVTRRIRANEVGTNQHIPIVALTGRVSEKEKAEALAAGADAWVGKPFDASSLHEIIESLATGEAPTAPLGAAAEPTVDVGLFMTQSGGMPDLAAELLDLARREWGELAPSLQPDTIEADLRIAGESAHRIKGVLGMLGAVEAAGWAAELERSANDGNVASARTAAEALHVAYERAERILLDAVSVGSISTN